MNFIHIVICNWLLVVVGSGIEVAMVIKFFYLVVVTGEFQRERERERERERLVKRRGESNANNI